MKKNLILILSLIMYMILSGCSSGNEKEEIVYNPNVEAFTSGLVSRYVSPSIILMEEIKAEQLKDGRWKKAVQLKPETKGTWSLEEGRILKFKPYNSLERDTRYEMSVDLSLLRNDVEEDFKLFTTSFRTKSLDVRADFSSLDINPQNNSNYDLAFLVQTSDRENPDLIESLVGAEGHRDISWQHQVDGKRHLLTVQNVAPEECLKLEILPNKEEVREEELCSVLVPAKDKFEVYDTKYVREPERFIEVTFTQALDKDQVTEGLAYITNNKSNLVTVHQNKLRLYPEQGLDGDLTVVLKKELKSISGLSLQEDRNICVSEEDGLPAVRFPGEGVIIPESDKMNVPFQAIGLRGVIVRVLKISEQNIGLFLQANRLNDAGELLRVGKLMTRQVIFLDEKNYDLSRWNTFALDLKEMIKPERGAIYRVILSFDQTLAACDCPDVEKKSKEQILADNELAFQAELKQFEGNSWYYQVDADLDWSAYNYKERNNPCKSAYYFNKNIGKNILATNIGLMAMSGTDGKMTVLVHSLQDAEPMGSVSVEAYNFQRELLTSGTTDGDGQLVLDFHKSGGKPYYLLAKDGDQRSYLKVNENSALSLSSFDVEGEVVQKGIKGFIYGERGVWRPGDTIHLGFMLFDRDRLLPQKHPVRLSLMNPLGQIYQQKVSTKGSNGLYVFHIPTDVSVPTGAWNAMVEVGGVKFDRKIRVESIKPNRLKIQLDMPEYLVKGRQDAIPLKVEWLQGATARNLKYDIKGTFIPAETTFKGYEDYKFDNIITNYSSEETQLITGRTDEYGNAVVKAQLNLGATAPGMLLGSLTTKVYEESGDFSIDVTRLYYSPFETYVGIQSPQKGEEALATGKSHRFVFASVNYHGQPVPGNLLDVSVYKVDWHWWWSSDLSNLANYVSSTYYKPLVEKHFQANGEGKVYYDFSVDDSDWGVYLIVARDRNSGHTSGLLSYFDWAGAQRSRNLNSLEEASILNLKIDKESYKPGETIRLHTPSKEGSRAVVSVLTGSKVLMVKEFECEPNGTDLEIPVTEEMHPNAYLHVTLLQPRGQTEENMPVRMFGVKSFMVDSEESHLNPLIQTADEWKPESKCEVKVSEKTGREMSYSLAVVDEGLLDLTRFRTPDPWKAFFAKEALGVNVWDLYNYVLGAYGGRIEELFSIGGDDALNKGPKAVVNRFAPVVKFAGPFELKKGEQKRHLIDMPNYNGRVRVMVVATNGSAYGNAEQSVMVRKPVMVLGTFPRVVGVGEEIVIPATVFATEDGVGEVNVSVRCPQGVEIIGESSKKISFTKKTDKTVYFRIRVKEDLPEIRISVSGTGKGETSVYADDLTVRSVRTKQVKTFQAIVKPGETWKQKVDLKGMNGTNRFSMDVSVVKPLNYASRLKELIDYPHACLEQIVSRSFPLLYVNDLAEQSSGEIKASEERVKRTINRLRSYQTATGAFSYWPGTTNTNGWGSVYALHFLLSAEGKGYAVPSSMKVNALNNIRRMASGWKLVPGNNRESSEKLVQAYRLFVLALAGKADVGAMNRLRVMDLPVVSQWMLASAYAQIGRTDVAGTLLKNTKQAESASIYAYDETFGSDFRNMAIRLQALNLVKEENEAAVLADRISKTLASDEWLSTQETAYALMVMSDYYKKYQSEGGDIQFSYQYADMQEKVQTKKLVWSETLMEKADKSTSELVVKNEGGSPLYVQAEAYGEVSQEKVEASDSRLKMSVSYQSADGSPLDFASLKKGTNFTVHVLVQNPTAFPLRNLVLTEIFPSGWEILNTRFIPLATNATDGNINYQDIRDDRVCSYIDYLAPGSHVLVRVNLCSVYQGNFYQPAITCEAMYDKKVYANSASGKVEVQ